MPCLLGSATLLIADDQLRCSFARLKPVAHPLKGCGKRFNLLLLARGSRLEILLLLQMSSFLHVGYNLTRATIAYAVFGDSSQRLSCFPFPLSPEHQRGLSVNGRAQGEHKCLRVTRASDIALVIPSGS
jgi:hypothetical protein